MTDLPARVLAIVSPHATTCQQPGCLSCQVAHTKTDQLMELIADAQAAAWTAERYPERTRA